MTLSNNDDHNHLLIDDSRDYGPMRTCRNYWDGIAALQEQTWEVLWLDYDMGTGYPTGMDVLLWLEKNPQHLPKKIQMVSLSPDYRQQMRVKADTIYAAWQEHQDGLAALAAITSKRGTLAKTSTISPSA